MMIFNVVFIGILFVGPRRPLASLTKNVSVIVSFNLADYKNDNEDKAQHFPGNYL